MKRCRWVGEKEIMIQYHDIEWGVPCKDDSKLFEYFVLDTFQAGLSWYIVLNKREGFRKAFHNFNLEKIIRYTQKDVERLLKNEGIIRNRLKINAVITNAKSFIQVQKEFGSFSNYIWSFTKNESIKNSVEDIKDVPTSTKLSDIVSKDLKSRGFKFVGTTIIYAFLQAIGIINDHENSCFRKDTV